MLRYEVPGLLYLNDQLAKVVDTARSNTGEILGRKPELDLAGFSPILLRRPFWYIGLRLWCFNWRHQSGGCLGCLSLQILFAGFNQPSNKPAKKNKRQKQDHTTARTLSFICHQSYPVAFLVFWEWLEFCSRLPGFARYWARMSLTDTLPTILGSKYFFVVLGLA